MKRSGQEAYEPRVPVAELYSQPGKVIANHEQLTQWARRYGALDVELDFADRPSVSLADAYRVRDARKREEAEWEDQRVRRAKLQSRVQAAQMARDDWVSRNRYSIGNAIPYAAGGRAMEHDRRAWQETWKRVRAEESRAGLPDDIQKRLHMPGPEEPYAWERSSDTAYHLPDVFKKETP